MRRNEETSPLPPESAGREDVIADEPQRPDVDQEDSPLPPDPPAREDVLRPDPPTA